MDGRYWMKMSTVNDLPAGAAVIRDIRWVAKVLFRAELPCFQAGHLCTGSGTAAALRSETRREPCPTATSSLLG